MKKALCIETAALFGLLGGTSALRQVVAIPKGFFDLPVVLLDRAECETDTAHLQLLPYIVLHSEKGRLFSYSRGGGGGESRLHAKLSVGLGGHVDGLPPENYDLAHWLKCEAARELEEEVGVHADPAEFHFTHLIIDRSDDVGRVHLGLLTGYNVVENTVMQHEAGVIESGAFQSLDDLFEAPQFERLEGWSELVVCHFMNARLGEFATRMATHEERGAFLMALGHEMVNHGLSAGASLDGKSRAAMVRHMVAHSGLDSDIATSLTYLDYSELTEAIDGAC